MRTWIRKNGRILCALLTAAVMCIAPTGCAGTGTSSDAASPTDAADDEASAQTSGADTGSKEPITLTWYTIMPQRFIPSGGIMDNPVYQEITKRTGVTLDFSLNVGVADSKEKIGIILASGELPDLITTDDYSINTNILKAQVAQPLDDLVAQYGPDIQANCATALDVSKVMRSDENNTLYFLPMDVVNGSNLNIFNPVWAWSVRWDLYKQLGYTEPYIESEEDLLRIAGEMLALEPTNAAGQQNYGIGSPMDSAARLMIPFTGNMGMYCATLEAFVDVGTGEMVSSFDRERSPFMQGVRFYNTANRMGLYDPECLVIKAANFYDKAATGRYMAMPYIWVNRSNVNQVFAEQGTPEKGYVPILVNGREDAMYMSDTLRAGDFPSTCITTACEDPQRAVEFINYLCTPEGAFLQKYGVEGEHWVNKDGYGTYTEEVSAGFLNDSEYAVKTGLNINGDYNYITFLDPMGLTHNGVDGDFSRSPEVIEAGMTELQKDFCTVNNLKYPAEYLEKAAATTTFDSWACATITLPTGSELAAMDEKIIPYMSDELIQLIAAPTEEELNAGLDRVTAGVQELGFDEVYAYMKQSYEELRADYDKLSNG